MANKRSYSDEQLRQAATQSTSIIQALRLLGVSARGCSYRNFRIYAERAGVDISHFTSRGHLKGKSHNWSYARPLSEILIENSDYLSTSNLKRRLLREKVLVNSCYKCGINAWHGQKLSLVLDHINGNNRDNRKENLRLLCPNCHSQTPTFAGRNKKK